MHLRQDQLCSTGSGALASGALASGALASGALASGALASGSLASGALASGGKGAAAQNRNFRRISSALRTFSGEGPPRTLSVSKKVIKLFIKSL